VPRTGSQTAISFGHASRKQWSRHIPRRGGVAPKDPLATAANALITAVGANLQSERWLGGETLETCQGEVLVMAVERSFLSGRVRGGKSGPARAGASHVERNQQAVAIHMRVVAIEVQKQRRYVCLGHTQRINDSSTASVHLSPAPSRYRGDGTKMQ